MDIIKQWTKDKWLTCNYCKLKSFAVGYLDVNGKDVPCCPICAFKEHKLMEVIEDD